MIPAGRDRTVITHGRNTRLICEMSRYAEAVPRLPASPPLPTVVATAVGDERWSRYLQIQDKDTTMPELLIDFITSLDGYAAADGWPGWWGLEGPEYLAWLGEAPEADYTVLMGATTYRLISGFAAEGEPGTDVLAGCRRSCSRRR